MVRNRYVVSISDHSATQFTPETPQPLWKICGTNLFPYLVHSTIHRLAFSSILFAFYPTSVDEFVDATS